MQIKPRIKQLNFNLLVDGSPPYTKANYSAKPLLDIICIN